MTKVTIIAALMGIESLGQVTRVRLEHTPKRLMLDLSNDRTKGRQYSKARRLPLEGSPFRLSELGSLRMHFKFLMFLVWK